MPDPDAEPLGIQVHRLAADRVVLTNMLSALRTRLDAAQLQQDNDRRVIGILHEINAIWKARALKAEERVTDGVVQAIERASR